MISNELREALLAFRHARDWEQFHTPRNLAVSLSLEANELLEHFQWARGDDEVVEAVEGRRAEIEDEVADLAIYLTYFCYDLGLDLEQAVAAKLARNEQRFPPDQVRGRVR